MQRRHSLILYLLLLAMVLALTSEAQTYNPFNERDDQYRLLGLKRARQAYLSARSEFERQQKLADDGLINARELELARNVFTDAEVNYQQSLLAVLFEKQYLTITEAVKYQDRDGAKRVRLKIANASGGSAEFRKLVEVDDELFRSLQPDVVNNVYISLLNEDNAIISQPYETKIDQLRFGKPQTVDFALLQDLDAITVFLVYGNGTQRTMKVFLQKDATVNRVAVQSEQFSQEIELGTSASFDLTLELYSGVSNTFSLEVVNLPDEVSRFFKDPSGQARLSQVKFTESTNSKRAALEIGLPDRPGDRVVMDTPIAFYVLVLPRSRVREISNLHDREWTEDELAALDVGYVRLELIPRGKGELMVRSPRLYEAIDAGDSAHITLELYNEGSHRLDNIEVRADIPLDWTKNIEPTSLSALEIGEEAPVHLSFVPPADVAPGKYNIRVRTTALSSSQPISTDDKTVTIEVRAGSNLFRTVVLVLLLLALVGGIVAYGVRLSRR